MTRKNISSFRRSDEFYGKLELLLTVKSFDLQAIRKRYIASRANKSGKAGSVIRRKQATGGIVYAGISNGKLTDEKVLCTLTEPRGIDEKGERIAISSENLIYVQTPDGDFRVRHPWLSYIHTVRFSPFYDDRILVSSSGLDIVFEFHYPTGDVTYEWCAWENGFRSSRDPCTGKEILLTRNQQEADRWETDGIPHLFIEDPIRDHLPTARRAAFINSVEYDPVSEDYLLATFFHEGAVYRIHRKSGQARKVIDGLTHPHGGNRSPLGMLATSTGSGEVVIDFDNHLTRFSVEDLPGKPEALAKLEWVQNSIPIGNLIVTVDSNRTSFVVFDPVRQLYSIIPYNRNWAVQDLIRLQDPACLEGVVRLSEYIAD